MKRLLTLMFLAAGTLCAQEGRVTPLMTKDIADVPGKEAKMITVDYAPGELRGERKQRWRFSSQE